MGWLRFVGGLVGRMWCGWTGDGRFKGDSQHSQPACGGVMAEGDLFLSFVLIIPCVKISHAVEIMTLYIFVGHYYFRPENGNVMVPCTERDRRQNVNNRRVPRSEHELQFVGLANHPIIPSPGHLLVPSPGPADSFSLSKRICHNWDWWPSVCRRQQQCNWQRTDRFPNLLSHAHFLDSLCSTWWCHLRGYCMIPRDFPWLCKRP